MTGKILQAFPQKVFKALQQLYNAILRIGHFPNQ